MPEDSVLVKLDFAKAFNTQRLTLCTEIRRISVSDACQKLSNDNHESDKSMIMQLILTRT